MKIYFDNTEIDLPVSDNSYRYRAIKGEHSLTLYYSLTQHIEIPIGAYCTFENEVYTLEKPENFKMKNSRNFEYTLIMDAPQAKLSKYKFKDTTSRKLKFNLTAQPQEHLKMLVDNLNLRESGWTVGECITAAEKVISYNHAYCIDALSQMADEFETEWEIVGKTINLRKVEYNKNNPLPLSYGRGNGFRSGIGRENEGDKKPVEILFVQGGDRNIDASKYGSQELLLPKNQTLVYEGITYRSDADGFSIRRADKPLTTQAEDSLDCSHIYPSRIGDVTNVAIIDAEKHFYDFFDNTIPGALNITDYIIEGETLTVIFQSGMLVGKEFEVKYIHKNRQFEIVPQELDGRTMPDDIFKPVIGDKYVIFGMSLPNSYVCNNSNKTGASWDMFREAAKYLYENGSQKFTFTGELDGIWSKKDWENIGGRIKLGGYILFCDNQFQPDGVAIRIVGIKDFINNPHSPIIELSNSVVGSSIISDLRKIESNEVFTENLYKEAIQFTKRRFRDSKETITMLENALLENFTNSISPITVQTMAALVGDESLQFRFVNSMTNPNVATHNVTYNNTTKILTSPAGIIQHMTLGIDTISSSHAIGEYKFWNMPTFNTPTLTDGSKKYYLYAKVSKTNTTGNFYISERAIALEEVTGYYHLLMGILNSEYDGERSYVSLYGYTEILPGRVTTDKIISSDGKTYFDLVKNEIAGKIKFLDGIITGDIGIGNDTGINAGMSGQGNSASNVRIWTGATTANKNNAPFRALHDGTLYASKAIFDGSVQTPFKSIYNKMFNVTSGAPQADIEAWFDVTGSVTEAAMIAEFGDSNRRILVGNSMNLISDTKGIILGRNSIPTGIILPVDVKYNGMVVSIFDLTLNTNAISLDKDYSFVEARKYTKSGSNYSFGAKEMIRWNVQRTSRTNNRATLGATTIDWWGGYLQFMCVLNTSGSTVQWVCLNY